MQLFNGTVSFLKGGNYITKLVWTYRKADYRTNERHFLRGGKQKFLPFLRCKLQDNFNRCKA